MEDLDKTMERKLRSKSDSEENEDKGIIGKAVETIQNFWNPKDKTQESNAEFDEKQV